MKNYLIKLQYVLIFICGVSYSQKQDHCLKEIFDIEESMSLKGDTSVKNKTVFMNYTVKNTDWDDQTITSNIKMYKNEQYLHFFSEQVNIYRDEKEVVIVLPIQKVIIISSTTTRLNNYKMSDSFLEMRKEFMDSCQVVRCESAGGQNKLIALKVDPTKVDPSIKMKDIIYEYNNEAKKITSVKVNYQSDYKIKQMFTTYKAIEIGSVYSFFPARRAVSDKKGNLLGKYAGYEIIDNRDKEKS